MPQLICSYCQIIDRVTVEMRRGVPCPRCNESAIPLPTSAMPQPAPTWVTEDASIPIPRPTVHRTWADIIAEANEHRRWAGAPPIRPEDTGEILRDSRQGREEEMPLRTRTRMPSVPRPSPVVKVTPPTGPVSPLGIGTLLRGPLKNFVYRVGVELEGGWVKVPEGVNLHADGSVCGITLSPAEQAQNEAASTRPSLWPIKLQTGELQSEPLEVRKVQSWMEQSYPSHVNDSCGLHVHMSFKSALHYMWLMRPEFQETMKEYIRRWAVDEGIPASHRLFSRLKGSNTYCRDEFHADGQASRTKKNYDQGGASRYTMINYPHGLHGTIEARLLPMFDTVDQAVKAVARVLDVTNACIVKLAQKEERVDASLVLNSGDTQRMIEETEEMV